MRKIESDMLDAIAAHRSAKLDNTEVLQTGPLTEVYLHGNLIARRDPADANAPGWSATMAGWPGPTTKSRLRALGARLTTKAGRTYANGREVGDSEWFAIEAA